MKTIHVLTMGSFAVGVGLWAGCGGSEVPVLQDDAQNLGAIDSGTGTCNGATCASGELCCASADATCTPTCTKATTCPVYGRPCIGDAGTDASTTALAWYTECGPPVCKVRPADAGVPTTSCANPGTACTVKGEQCGTPDEYCDTVVVVCDDHDPKGPGESTCPVSTKKAKQDIGYVNQAELQRLHDETLSMRLATYRYKGPFVNPNDPAAKHLGFIIEDQPESLSVDRAHDRVDLYGYMSMAVATMQVQDKQIAELEREVDAFEEGLREVTV